MFSSHDFQQYVLTPTRGTAYLNLLFCNSPEIVKNVEIIPPIGGSDLAAVEFNLDIRGLQSPTRKRRDFSTADYSGVQHYLSNIDWIGSFGTASSVNEMYEIFVAVLHHCTDQFVPLRNIGDEDKYIPLYIRRMIEHRN